MAVSDVDCVRRFSFEPCFIVIRGDHLRFYGRRYGDRLASF